MKPSDKPAMVAMVTDALAYYGKPVSAFTLQVWVQACQPFSIEQVSKALTAHATDPERGQFAPKVADIVRILSGTATDRAALAWGKCLKAMSSVGAYTDVVFDDGHPCRCGRFGRLAEAVPHGHERAWLCAAPVL